MDDGARFAIEAVVEGLYRAGAINSAQAQIVADSVVEMAKSVGGNMPAEGDALMLLARNIRHQTRWDGPA